MAAVVILVNVLLIELIAQGCVRLLGADLLHAGAPIAVEDPRFGWTFRGCRNQSDAGFGAFQLCFDDSGLRRGDTSLGEAALMVLGNSITLGQQVPADRTFVARLEGLNAGFDGYTTFQIRDRFRADLSALNSSRILLVVGADDILTELEGARRKRNTLLTNMSIKRTNWIKNAVRREGLYQLAVWRSVRHLKDPGRMDEYFFRLVSQPADRDAMRDWETAVLSIRDAVRDTFILVLSPPRAQVRDFRAGGRRHSRNAEVALFCRAHGIPLIDLLPVLSAHPVEGTYIDPLHYSAEGHERVAAEIRSRLRELTDAF